MDPKWLKKGPKFEELTARIRDERTARNTTAIIIPTCRRKATLVEHLRRLSAQTYKDFDVIIVYNEKEEFLAGTPCISAAHILQNGDRGSAGSFYCGQRFALDNDYDRIIMADDDCLPESQDLLMKLTAAIDGGADVVFPKITDERGMSAASMVLWQYGCVRASVLRKVGLAYLPFYFAGEDIELEWRIARSGAVRSEIDARAYHRSSHLVLMNMIFLCSPRRVFYYNRALALFKYITGAFPAAFMINLSFICMAIALMPMKKQTTSAVIDALTTAATMGFFRKDRHPDDAPLAIGLAGNPHRIEIEPERAKAYGNGLIPLILEMTMFPRCFSLAAEVFGKDVIFHERIMPGYLPGILAARRGYLESYGKHYLVTDNRYFWLAPLAGLAILVIALAAVIPVFLLTCMGFVMLKAKGIVTHGYGLGK